MDPFTVSPLRGLLCLEGVMPSRKDSKRDETLRLEGVRNSHHPKPDFVDHTYEVVDAAGVIVAEGVWTHPVRGGEGGGAQERDEASALRLVWSFLDSLGYLKQGLVFHFRCLGGRYTTRLEFESCSLRGEIRREGAKRVGEGLDL